MAKKYTNSLINEKSPYLQQHAHNPVNWYPWNEEAFQKAKDEDKPIFLSIGYSTCHWCHVMEKESFEDVEVAELLNEGFISIKVDREERPDIDNIYMTACSIMTGQGGWPLNILMGQDKKPFYAGTYFPKRNRYGRTGLIELLTQVNNLWRNDRKKITDSAASVNETLIKDHSKSKKGNTNLAGLNNAFNFFRQSFDEINGGFGKAPKFPTPHNLMFLLRYYRIAGNKKALEMAEKTLVAMYKGGIYDHIGFGFSRYSVDEKWLVPHFEKMLYDNALLALSYFELYSVKGKELYLEIADQILTYVLREMTSPEGGFYSAQDADSEGVEGKYYVWTYSEIVKILGIEEGREFCKTYNITSSGNFDGMNIPNLIGSKTPEIFRFKAAKNKLYEGRIRRIQPFKDDKILLAWNGLMIAAFSVGYRISGNKSYLDAAVKSAGFVFSNMIDDKGRLFSRFRDGEAKFPAYLEDYAFFIWGLIELYQSTFDLYYLKQALALNRDMLRIFSDEVNGGLFQTGYDSEPLIIRPKDIHDGALPSGNSVAALNLLRLYAITGDDDLKAFADIQMKAFGGAVNEAPYYHTFYLMAAALRESSPEEVRIIGNIADQKVKEMLLIAGKGYNPQRITVFKDTSLDADLINTLIPAYKDMEQQEGKATAYVCRNFKCSSAVTEPAKLKELLKEQKQ
ncbi:MAG: thioredoxin domain-containing protein [Eubacteriaceae bacterium]|nr:thioredoxin domain-containing protein [Eubacteriaceae bacterium]